MQKAEAIEILSKANFEEDELETAVSLARSGKAGRLSVIRKGAEGVLAATCAVIEITRHWRGYLCRKNLKTLFGRNDANVSASIVGKQSAEKEEYVAPHFSQVSSGESVDTIPVHESKVPSMIVSKDVVSGSHPTDMWSAAEEVVQIEEAGYIDEIEMTAGKVTTAVEKEVSPVGEKTLKKKATPRVKKAKKPTATLPLRKAQAATIIQKAWRRHIDMQVFRYYRDLINFRRQGNPALMLRCINPAEAKLLDAATGTHIKFRLAGEKFPPNIYYKIYTHRPVVDMCANSPKDYTRAETKQPTSKQVHNRELSYHDGSEKEGWYMRYENNGWRLVSDRLIHAAMDPTTWETSRQTMQFHHSNLQRKADLDKRRKQKKIAWMHKMYKQGLLQVKITDPETSDLVKKAADGLINTVDVQGPDGVMDWEVDELLQWTTALNFDDYLEGWKETATSNISEYGIEDMLAGKSSKQNITYDLPIDSFAAYPESERKQDQPHIPYIDTYAKSDKYT